MTRTGLVKATSVLAALTVASKILGFLRETSLAAVFGATSETDAYLLAQTIPYLLFTTVSYALTTTFIPVYSQVREGQGKESAFQFANTVLWAVILVGVTLVGAGELLAKYLVRLIAPGLDLSVANLTEYLSRIILPMMIFQLLTGVVAGILQAEGNFTVPAIAGLAQNVSIIIFVVFFGKKCGIVSAAVGTLVGAGLSLLLKLPALLCTGFRWQVVWVLNNPALRRMAVLMLPAILAAGANEINTLVDRMLASGLPEGRVSALNYANKLMQLAPGIIGSSIVTVIYPTLAKLAARGDWKRFNQSLVESLSLMQSLLVPIAVGVLVLREPLIRIVYERGAFDSAATYETARALLFLSMGIAVSSPRLLVNRAFFTLQDTVTPLVLGVTTVGINVILNLILVGPMEQAGLALATVLATMVGYVLGLFAVNKKTVGHLPWRRLATSTVKVLIASIVMGRVVMLTDSYLRQLLIDTFSIAADVCRVVVSTTVGGVVYCGMAWALRVREMRLMVTYGASFLRNLKARFGRLLTGRH